MVNRPNRKWGRSDVATKPYFFR